jgi:ketosteroid isomerase-like protein
MLNRNDKLFGPKLAFCISLTLLLLAAACGPATPPDNRAADVSALRDLDAQWSKTAGTNDVDATVAYYSDDASLLPPNAPIVIGKQSIRAAWAALLAPGVSLSWSSDKVEAARSSDLAYMTGSYTMSTKQSLSKAPVTDHGKYVEVWKKQADGKWKVVADIFNSDQPEQAPAPAAAPTPAKKTKHQEKHKKKHHRS